MNKDDFKKIFAGAMLGCLSLAQTGVAEEEKALDQITTLAADEDKLGEEIFAAGCGGKHGCGGRTTNTQSNPQRNMTQDDQEYQQPQPRGSSCSAYPRPQA